MPTFSPHVHDAQRVLDLLQGYDRTGVWLRLWQEAAVPGPPEHAWLEVVDASGVELADREGRVRPLTFDEPFPWLPLIPGRSVHLHSEGASVRVHLLPVASEVVLGDFFRDLPGQPSA